MSVLERTYAEKWTVEKTVYIHYMLQAREVMHIIGGPLQRNAMLTFSSCLDWRASLSGCVSVFCVTMGNILNVYFSDTFSLAC